jgi:RNA polymerase sigma-70 factor (ECF subfamily)
MRRTGASIDELERLYRSRFSQYLRVAEAVAGGPEGGLDAVQEGFVRAIRYRADFRGDSQLSTWVWRSVVNAAKAIREERVRPSDLPSGEAATPNDQPATSVRRLIASLPERQKLALFLRYYADMDYHTIASVLGVEEGTIGATLSQARATLRRELDREEVSR